MSDNLSVADVLERAADLIEPEGAWTQGCGSRDDSGANLDDAEPGEGGPAVCFCAAEAIWRVNALYYGINPAHQFMMRFVGGEIPKWNDAPERTQAEVVAKLREAAALARKQGK